MPKSTIYLINTLLVVALITALAWIGVSITDWYKSKSYHGYAIYNCPQSISVKNMSWFEIKDKCEIVEYVNDKFFEVDETKIKERARDWSKTTKFMTHVRIQGETSSAQDTYYKIW
ncbi:MAG: hypothetical protein ACLTYF_21980 [Escherichia sp.]